MNTLGSLTQAIRLTLLTLTTAIVATLAMSPAFGQVAYYGAAYRAVPSGMQYQAPPPGYGYASQPRVISYGPAPRAIPVAYVARPAEVRRALPMPTATAAPRRASSASAMGYLDYNGRYASAPSYMPAPVRVAVSAGNQLQNKPYLMGGGHKRVNDYAYDCSGSVSYCLIKAGLLVRPLSSREFANYGEAGPGKFITIYVKPGDHVFMTICGLRLDTTGGSEGQGPRWRPSARSMSGFTARHPFGL